MISSNELAKQLVNSFFASHTKKEIDSMVQEVKDEHKKCGTKPCAWCQFCEEVFPEEEK